MTGAPDPRGRRAGLSREVVADGALRVLDRDGPAGLTMRGVGAELGVQAMSLYNHVADKEDLLDAIAERVVAAVEPPPPELACAEALRVLARRLRVAVLAHPHAAVLVASRPLASPAALVPVEATLAALRRAGLTPDDAVAAFWLLTSYIAGALVGEAAAATERRQVPIGPAGLPRVAGAEQAMPTLAELAPLIAQSDYAVQFEWGLEQLIATITRRG